MPVLTAEITDFPETKIGLPWASDPAVSWLAYEIWLECFLDPGTVLHKPLPQVRPPSVDSLTSAFIDQPGYAAAQGGTELASASQAKDVIQRMATSTYTFVLRGFAVRAGYQIPIPGIVSVGGYPVVAAVPTALQRAFNRVVGNWSGVPIFYAEWEIPYLIASPVRLSPGAAAAGASGDAPVPGSPALRIRGDAQPPAVVKLPTPVSDERAVSQGTFRVG